MKIITKTLFTLILLLSFINCSNDDSNSENEENPIESNKTLIFQHNFDRKREFIFFNFNEVPEDRTINMQSDVKYMYDGELICDGKAHFIESGVGINFKTVNCHNHEKFLFKTGSLITAEYDGNFMRTNSIFEDERHTFVNKDYIPPTD